MVSVGADNILAVWADNQAGDDAAEVAKEQLWCLEACRIIEHFTSLRQADVQVSLDVSNSGVFHKLTTC